MKFIFAIVSLICLALANNSLAGPVPDSVGSAESRIVPYVNCLIHCVQPVGKESESDEVQTRGILSNYGTFYECSKKCAKN
jgi:hypothetical protein